MTKITGRIFLLFLFSIISISFVNSAEFKDIVITGNERYNDLFYKDFIKTRKFTAFNNSIKNKIIDEIFFSGVIDDVKINYNEKTKVLYVDIKEQRLIKRIIYKGNKKLTAKIIGENTKIKEKENFSNYKLQQQLNFLRSFYDNIGFLYAEIEHNVKILDDNTVEITFDIKENKKVKINSITIVGNKKMSSRKIKDAIFSREDAFFRFGGKIVYNENYLDYDAYLMRQFFYQNGFMDFDILSKNATYNKQKKKFDIVFNIVEGEQYIIGDIVFKNNVEDFDSKKIEKEINSNIKIGQIIDYGKIMSLTDSINYKIAQNGNLYVELKNNMLPNRTDKTITLEFIVDVAKKEYIGSININNNTKTYDYVIREQLLLDEGDILNKNQLEKSIQRIYNLGFFKNVDYKLNKREDGNYDIDINIEEKSTGSIGGSIGYSTLDRQSISINYSQMNLFGKGISAGVDLSFYRYAKRFTFNMGKPNIFGSNIYWGTNVYFTDDNDSKNSVLNTSYDSLDYGMDNSFSFRLTDNITQRIGYSISLEHLQKVSPSYRGVIREGKTTTSKLINSFSYDTRDYYNSPTKGVVLSLSNDFAGLGGDKKYISSVLYGAYYKKIFGDFVLKLEAKYGHIASFGNESLYPTDGFKLGGYSMRGFKSSGLGPRVKPLNPDTPLKYGYGVGGTDLYFYNVELKIPLGLPKEIEFYPVLFFNAGTVTGVEDNKNIDKDIIVDSGSIRSAMGISFIWKTPMNINISFDFSKILKKEDYDLSENFRFNIGKDF